LLDAPFMGVKGVILVEDGEGDWWEQLYEMLVANGCQVARLRDLGMTPYLLLSGGAKALFLGGRRLSARDLAILAKVRRLVPTISVVVVANGATLADLKRAMENGATTYLSWPVSEQALLAAVERTEQHAAG
jgi:DNA-binding NtrC family response regulator